ncbi:MAG: tRNA lysidine(34) synthetase TilS [Deltaproteobacteria bacterium]|nr:tRNA lysidine(34) synthetase TilS [Deltaproteobacteria bacterium]
MHSLHKTLQKVKETISRYEMIQPEDLVVVAVSGGPDSVCLLSILHELKDKLRLRLIVAHFDHGLRPADDESETAFVRSLAESLKLPFETAQGHMLAKNATASREEAARNTRYAFLERVKEKHKAQKIALGHNLNDQAETILMRLLRGSGPSGLTGIPPCRDGSIIRPLIKLERPEIEKYLKGKKLASVTDPSNLSTEYLRNRIRLEFMPLLEKHQPQLVRLLGQTAEILRDEHDYLEKVAGAWLKRALTQCPDNSYEMSIASFLDLPVALRRRTARHLIGMVKKDLRRITWDHIEAIGKLAQDEKPQAVLKFPGGFEIRRTYDRLGFHKTQKKKEAPFLYTLDTPGQYKIEEIGRTLSIEEIRNTKALPFRGSVWRAFLDGEKLRFPLTLRLFKPGDRFIPFGMKGHKKLKDFFVDLKVPMEQRRSTPILCCDDKPAWVCGFRIDDRFKVTPQTKKIMKITLGQEDVLKY